MAWSKSYTIDQYHGDELKDHFGSTDIKNYLRSPAHCRYNKDNPKDPTDALIFGDMFHTLILGDRPVIECPEIPEVDLRKKEDKAKYQAFKEKIQRELGLIETGPRKFKHRDGRTILLNAKDYKKRQGMLNAIREHRFAAALLDAPGEVEITGTFREPTYGIPGKIRPDKLNRDDQIMIDLKTTIDASEENFSKTIFNFGYDVQGCWYNIGGHQIDKKGYEFIIIAVEKDPPHGVNTFRLTEKHFEIAYSKIDSILDSLKRCIEKDRWPCYPQKIINPEIPAWEHRKYHS